MPLIRFPDPAIASEQLKCFGYDLKLTQLDKGGLNGHVAGHNCEEVIFLEFGSDRSLLVQGQPVPGYLPFAVAVPGSDIWFHGESTQGGQLCGYNANLSETHCRTAGVMKLILLPLQRVYGHMLECGAHLAAERLMATNYVELSPEATNDFVRIHSKGVSGLLAKAEQCYHLMTTLLCSAGQTELFRPAKNARLLREMVHLAHDKAEGEALSLKEIATFLNCKDSTLREACVKSYGVTVKNLFKHVRLEQVRYELGNPESLQPVERVFSKYGFSPDNLSRHRKLYRETFGERPIDTAERGRGQLMLGLH